jgi:hypothetical protein
VTECNKLDGITNEDVRTEPRMFSLNQEKQKKTEKRMFTSKEEMVPTHLKTDYDNYVAEEEMSRRNMT